ncbi:hypothetical protein [Novosphingobium sp. 9U]|uniref:hypothetical protein n=1 Tax=Novosphingobium sp. 9U TaxID=2653158 RepID=UPI0013598E80|nr:hypothetical protein [Novosphingobium sp. 9U]
MDGGFAYRAANEGGKSLRPGGCRPAHLAFAANQCAKLEVTTVALSREAAAARSSRHRSAKQLRQWVVANQRTLRWRLLANSSM